MNPFDRAEAAWESTWVDGPDYDRPEDDAAEVSFDGYQPFPEPADAGEEQGDDIPF